MKAHVIRWANGERGQKLVSKETLNHRALIELVSGLDVYEETPEAYRRAYQALGIDLINRAPLTNAPEPTPAGQIRPVTGQPYHRGNLGVYDTSMRHTYLCRTPEEVWSLDMSDFSYEDLITPVPHPCKARDIRDREAVIGDIGLYYPMLYTTLFMWPVEFLGWEVFMVAAWSEPERFHEHVILPCVTKSKAIVTEMAEASDSPLLFVHDDLAGATGPMFDPKWYDDYIFPHYPEIWSRAKELGRKIIFVADGNMEAFLPKLVDAGIDGLMFENPATSLDAVIEHFGRPGRFMIGGIDTALLTTGTPETVRAMVLDLEKKTRDCSGFAISSCGGLHGNIPQPNLEAYFDARARIGATPTAWRDRCKT